MDGKEPEESSTCYFSILSAYNFYHMKYIISLVVAVVLFGIMSVTSVHAECVRPQSCAGQCQSYGDALQYAQYDSCMATCNSTTGQKYQEYLNCVEQEKKQAQPQPVSMPTTSPIMTPAPAQSFSSTTSELTGKKFTYPESRELYDKTLSALKAGTATSADVGNGGDKDPGKPVRDRVRDRVRDQQIACNVPCENKPNESTCRDACYQTAKPIYDEMDSARQNALDDWYASTSASKNQQVAPLQLSEIQKQQQAEGQYTKECGGAQEGDPHYQVCIARKDVLDQQRANIVYRVMKGMKKGEILSAPTDKKMSIDITNGTINAREGSSLRYMAEDTWIAARGAFRFVIEGLAARRQIKVTSLTAVAAVRGTQFLLKTQGDTTDIQVLKGMVPLSDALNKKKIDVKEGFQASVKGKTVRKAVKFNAASLDTWYNDIPPSAGFWEESWKKVSSTTSYKRECVTTAGTATSTQELTAEEQAQVEKVNTALKKFRIKEVNTIDARTKKLYVSREKTDSDGKRLTEIAADAKKMYYRGPKIKSWKAYPDAKFSAELFRSASTKNLSYSFDKPSFDFQQWSGALARTAQYAGAYTLDGVDELVGNLFNVSPEQGQEKAYTTISVDEANKLWTRYNTTVNVKSGKLNMPVTQVCTLSYGDAAKIALPKKAQSVGAAIGNKELMEVSEAVQ